MTVIQADSKLTFGEVVDFLANGPVQMPSFSAAEFLVKVADRQGVACRVDSANRYVVRPVSND